MTATGERGEHGSANHFCAGHRGNDDRAATSAE